MFGRGKGNGERHANRLSDEARPNVLYGGDGERGVDDEYPGVEDGVGASGGFDDLQAELEREAREFGFVGDAMPAFPAGTAGGLDGFLERLAELTEPELAALVGAWTRQPRDELARVWKRVRAVAAAEPERRDTLRLGQDTVSAWLNGPPHVLTALAAVPSQESEARLRAAPAVADALAATLFADALDPADADLLYAPWASAIGDPELRT